MRNKLFVIGSDTLSEEDFEQIQSQANARFNQIIHIPLPTEYGVLKTKVGKQVEQDEDTALYIDWIGLFQLAKQLAKYATVEGQNIEDAIERRMAQFPLAVTQIALFLSEKTGRTPLVISALRDELDRRYFRADFPDPR